MALSFEDYLPGRDPAAGKPVELQIGYWKERAKFFEERAYALLERLKELQEEVDDSDWWKAADD